jgi:hypothetical protein
MPASLLQEHIGSRKNWCDYITLSVQLHKADVDKNREALRALQARLAQHRAAEFRPGLT